MVNAIGGEPVDLDCAIAVAAAVPDPELPFLTVSDLGILRAVTLDGDVVVAEVSPTYSGCPAVAVIEQAILEALQQAGFQVRVQRVMSPPWTTDWITPDGRAKLLANGIAPPSNKSTGAHAVEIKPLLFARTSVACPLCESTLTQKISEFGSTPCKAQYRCDNCGEPFDYFKCL